MVFLDYASTNPWPKYKCSDYYRPLFNVNANYAFAEKRMLDEAEEHIKTAIDAKNGKVVFGGTSSQLIESLFTHITEETSNYITVGSVYEHDSVWRFVEQWGNIDSLEHVIQTYHGDKQLIVCLMGVNNLTGEIFPVKEIGKLCHEHNAFYICDMTAMIGHASIPANLDDWCDCAFWSGHKIGTELGIGCMWLSDKINDWLDDFKLHGTPNLAGAMAIADATEDAVKNVVNNFSLYNKLYSDMFRSMMQCDVDFEVISGEVKTTAINAIHLNGINADALQQYLASKRFYVGLGASACAESHDYRVLNVFGLSNKEASEVIRVSFGENSSADDVKALVSAIKEFEERFVR